MKKIVSALLVCILLVGCTLALVSCGGPSGKYKGAELFGISTTYEFSGSKVTITTGAGNLTYTLNGEFEMGENDKGEETITFTFGEGEEDSEEYSGTHTYVEGEEDGVKYIKIDGVKYTKVD